jgi:hypothetical protein
VETAPGEEDHLPEDSEVGTAPGEEDHLPEDSEVGTAPGEEDHLPGKEAVVEAKETGQVVSPVHLQALRSAENY